MVDVDILLVEDNHGDVHLVERAFERADLPGRLHVVQTGGAALDWLYRRDDHAEAPRPDLVLLDLNLPAIGGREVLETIKSDPGLRRTPVVVLTGSQSPADIVDVYDRHANACLIKPVDPDEFADVVGGIVEFWVATAMLPPPAEGSGRG